MIDDPRAQTSAAEPVRSRQEKKLHRARDVAFAVGGTALAVAGATAVFTTANGAGAGVLLGVGAALLLLVFFGDRLVSLKAGGIEIALRDQAAEKERQGDIEGARILQRAADTLGGRAMSVAERYEAVRKSMPAGAERTQRMDAFFKEAQKHAEDPTIDREQVLEWLWTASSGVRVWALGVLQAKPELATTRALLEAIERPDDVFDRQKALLVARDALPHLRQWQQERLAWLIRWLKDLPKEDPRSFGTDSGCIDAANEFLRDFDTWQVAWDVLDVLASNTMSAGEVADASGRDHLSVITALDNLAETGAVTKGRHGYKITPSDARSSPGESER